MKKKMTPITDPRQIPPDMTEEEAREFFDTHEFTEEYMEKVGAAPEEELPPTRPRTKPISLRFDEDLLGRLKEMAKVKRKGYQTMLKEFVIERLYEEETREGMLRKAEGSRRPGRPGEGWDETYRRLLAGSEGEWTDDPLSNIGALVVAKAAASALGMDFGEFGAWVRETPEKDVRAKLSEEEAAKNFRRELDRFWESAAKDLEHVKSAK